MHLENSRILLEKYYCSALDANITKRGEHLLHEVRSRLKELQWLHVKISEISEKLIEEAKNRNKEQGKENSAVILVYMDTARPNCENYDGANSPPTESDELRILLESYYYSAHRVGDILRDGKKELPGINGFDCKGIREVRNHLVEHPTKKFGVIVFSFMISEPLGPQLKPLRWSLDPKGVNDDGLWKNAESFEHEINRRLERAIEKTAL